MSAAISVIIPVYNGARYLAEALRSVTDQTLPPDEILVIDDSSTDDSAAIARAFDGVRVITQVQAGAAAARNHGVAEATGDILAFLDADDTWLPDKLALQMPRLDQASLIFGHVQHFFSPDLDEAQRAGLQCPPEAKAGYLPTTFLCPHDVFMRVGRFDIGLRSGEFIHWYAQAKELGLTAHLLAETVAMRRIHASNHTRQRENLQDYLHVVKAALDRRRVK